VKGSIAGPAKMTTDKIKEIEEKIADLKARWPAHSVPPSMWQQLEELEDKLEAAKKEESNQSSRFEKGD
jgi:hypothetical protein